MVKTSPAPQHSSFVKTQVMRAGLVTLAIAIAWTIAHLPRPRVEPLRKGVIPTWVRPPLDSSARAIATPQNWQAIPLTESVTSYTASLEDSEQFTDASEYLSENYSRNYSENDIGEAIARIDGTRFPYVTDITWTELINHPVSPGQYSLNRTWEGEGYNRVLDQNDQLVAEREGGVNIHLHVTLDQTITDPQQPNLIITVQNDQDETAQLTNISAFWLDKKTGETLDRQDFAQLPPIYEVTVSRNGGYGGTETKILDRQGILTFAYHLTPEQIKWGVPIRIEGVNQAFAERQQELYDLQAKGWVVKEVPAPSL